MAVAELIARLRGVARSERAKRVAPYVPVGLIAGLAIVIAWGFAAMTLHYTPSMGLPLDDSYIYLTYAKQFGRAQPFTYFPGGGYSAGSTSVLWPMVLAPFWTLGARGHALVWVSFGACSTLFALVGIGWIDSVHVPDPPPSRLSRAMRRSSGV